MVRKDEVRAALTRRWQSTPDVAGQVPRTARSGMVHRQQVYAILRRMAEDAEAECYTGHKGVVYWRRI